MQRIIGWRDSKATVAERGYGGKWQRLRLDFLKKNPLCVYCQREGRVTEAKVVDHIIPHRGDQKLFWNQNNWQALCKSWHTKSARYLLNLMVTVFNMLTIRGRVTKKNGL